MSHNILAIDQGTTNTKALLVDPSGHVLARGSQPTAISYPQPGWVEQDALDIWRGTLAAVEQCLAGLGRPDLAAIAISNQRETALVWERATGRPLGPCVVWQCHRSAAICNELKARGRGPILQARTGLQVDPMFSASKLRWLLDHIPDGQARAENGELCAGNVDAWLLWNLTGGRVHATDMTNASRTQLMSLADLAWDADRARHLRHPGRDPARNPAFERHLRRDGSGRSPAGRHPHRQPDRRLARVPLRPGRLPAGERQGHLRHRLIADDADACAGVLREGPFDDGGVGAHPPRLRKTAGLRSGARNGGRAIYALEGNIYATGAAVQWVGELLRLADPGPEVEKLARTVADTAGVYFVPALTGLGAPHWSESARGLIAGLTRGAGAGHLARAALEAIAYQVRDVFDAMQAEAGTALTALLADGGASRSDLLMQFQADMLGCAVLRSTSPDVSPLGAAFLAGLAVGLWADEAEIEALVPPRDRFAPQMPADRRAALYAGWRAAVARTIFAPGRQSTIAHG